MIIDSVELGKKYGCGFVFELKNIMLWFSAVIIVCVESGTIIWNFNSTEFRKENRIFSFDIVHLINMTQNFMEIKNSVYHKRDEPLLDLIENVKIKN